MADFLRQLRHLLPDALAWRTKGADWVIGDDVVIGDDIVIGGATSDSATLWRFLRGLCVAPEAAVAYVDDVFEDALPSTTRQLADWEAQFGLPPAANEDARRLQLAAAWSATGGQSPHYLQSVVQAAGFPLYVHEWWSSGPPYVARDPRNYTDQPLIGDSQCSALTSQPQCSALASQPQCSAFLANEPGYLVNRDLTRRAPPPVPADPSKWRHFMYLGAATFPNRVSVPSARRAELERLVLKLRPSQLWVVMLVDYV